MAAMTSLLSPASDEAAVLHDSLPLSTLYKNDKTMTKKQKKMMIARGKRGTLKGKKDMAAERVRVEAYCRRNAAKSSDHPESGDESDHCPEGGGPTNEPLPPGHHRIHSLGRVSREPNPLTGKMERGFFVRWEGCMAVADTWEPESSLPRDLELAAWTWWSD